MWITTQVAALHQIRQKHLLHFTSSATNNVDPKSYSPTTSLPPTKIGHIICCICDVETSCLAPTIVAPNLMICLCSTCLDHAINNKSFARHIGVWCLEYCLLPSPLLAHKSYARHKGVEHGMIMQLIHRSEPIIIVSCRATQKFKNPVPTPTPLRLPFDSDKTELESECFLIFFLVGVEGVARPTLTLPSESDSDIVHVL